MILIHTDGGIVPGRVPGRGIAGGTGVVAAHQVPGAVHLLAESSEYHPGDTTNQVMELEAARRGLAFWEAVRGRSALHADLPVTLCSDSAYVINCLTAGWWVKWVLKTGWKNAAGNPVENIQQWRALLSRVRGVHDCLASRLGPSPWRRLGEKDGAMARAALEARPVAFQKVKGHSTDALNNRADALATVGKNGWAASAYFGALSDGERAP